MIPSVVGHFRRLRRLSKSGHWRQTSLSPLSLSLSCFVPQRKELLSSSSTDLGATEVLHTPNTEAPFFDTTPGLRCWSPSSTGPMGLRMRRRRMWMRTRSCRWTHSSQEPGRNRRSFQRSVDLFSEATELLEDHTLYSIRSYIYIS